MENQQLLHREEVSFLGCLDFTALQPDLRIQIKKAGKIQCNGCFHQHNGESVWQKISRVLLICTRSKHCNCLLLKSHQNWIFGEL